MRECATDQRCTKHDAQLMSIAKLLTAPICVQVIASKMYLVRIRSHWIINSEWYQHVSRTDRVAMCGVCYYSIT